MIARDLKLRPRAWLILVAVVVLGAGGCGGQPQVASDNRELLVSLTTAVSARNADWLEANAREIEKKRSAGQINDSEYQKFTDVLKQARAGQWRAAEESAYAWRDGQEPTAEDQKNLSERRLEPDHVGRKLPSRGGKKSR